MSGNRLIGICMLSYAVVLSAAVWWYPPFVPKHGGHDLVPLLFIALPLSIGGLGLAINTRLSKLISSLLFASAGLWFISRDILFFVSRHSIRVINCVIGLLLCIPAIITLCRKPAKVAA